MTPEQQANVDKWVAALRSGKYEQTHGMLRRGDKYCCLGVLCETLGIEPTPCSYDIYSYEGARVSLPVIAMNMTGIKTCEGEFRTAGGNLKILSKLNDQGTPFTEIADIIESKPEGLFL